MRSGIVFGKEGWHYLNKHAPHSPLRYAINQFSAKSHPRGWIGYYRIFRGVRLTVKVLIVKFATLPCHAEGTLSFYDMSLMVISSAPRGLHMIKYTTQLLWLLQSKYLLWQVGRNGVCLMSGGRHPALIPLESKTFPPPCPGTDPRSDPQPPKSLSKLSVPLSFTFGAIKGTNSIS